MNDLFLNNLFRRYNDLEHQIYIDEVRSEVWDETVNLDGFFKQIEKVKGDMGAMEKLYKRLEEANEESKEIHERASRPDGL